MAAKIAGSSELEIAVARAPMHTAPPIIRIVFASTVIPRWKFIVNPDQVWIYNLVQKSNEAEIKQTLRQMMNCARFSHSSGSVSSGYSHGSASFYAVLRTAQLSSA